ncbi:MAG: hypothetical protein IRY92_04080 [Dactylosporangium sp.]|nr:hypothetical protein [Dactylosporangium sp.]
MRRALWSVVVVALIGLLAVGGGLSLLTTDRVECEIGREMQPGETCVNAQRPGRAPISLTYEEQQASNRRVGGLTLGFGVVALGYAGWLLWQQVRRRPSG